MRDRAEDDPYQPPTLVRAFPPLPAWLARRLLGPEEQVNWVRGPRLSPWWERYATHPLLFVAALAVGAACVAAERLRAGSWPEMSPLPALAAVVIALGSIFVLGFCAGYFTRLVVTDARVFIVQGYEVCCSWDLDELPDWQFRYGQLEGVEERQSVGVA